MPVGAAGERVVIEVVSNPCSRTNRSKDVTRRVVYWVRRLARRVDKGRGCLCDVEAGVRVYVGGTLQPPSTRFPEKLSIFPHRDKYKVYRLAVKMNNRVEWLQRVVGFAWHRDLLPPGAELVSNTWEADHLESSELETCPSWCLAGWIEAVPKDVHRVRTAALEQARKVRDRVAEIEEEARQRSLMTAAFDRLAARKKPTKKHLADMSSVKRKIDKLPPVSPAMSGIKVVPRRGTRVLFDIEWSEAGAVDFHGHCGNKLVASLFVDAEMPARKALIARCYDMCKKSAVFVKPHA